MRGENSRNIFGPCSMRGTVDHFLRTLAKRHWSFFFMYRGGGVFHPPYKNLFTVSIDERRPKMYLLFSHSKNGKFAPFLTYLKSWWKVVLNFGKEHANWSNISEVTIGWSWQIKFGKINYFLATPILSFPNLIF